MRAWVGVGLVLVLAGCADNTSYLTRIDRIAETQMRADYRKDIAGPDFAVLNGRVDLTETLRKAAPACSSTAADTYPTPAESAALHRWIELRTGYFLGIEALQIRAAAVSEKAGPAVNRYVDILREGLKRSTALISDLADGKMTYCRFAEADQALTVSMIAEAGPLHAELVKILAASDFIYPTADAGEGE